MLNLAVDSPDNKVIDPMKSQINNDSRYEDHIPISPSGNLLCHVTYKLCLRRKLIFTKLSHTKNS